MNPLEDSSIDPEEPKLPFPSNIIVNELDNPSIIITTSILPPPLSLTKRILNKFNLLLRKIAHFLEILWKCFISFCFILDKYALSIYFIFNTFLLLALITKLIIYPKVVYYWIGSSCLLFFVKFIEFLRTYRSNNMRSFELLDRLENQIRLTRARNIIRRATHHSPFLQNLFSNEQNIVNVLNINENQYHFSRFSQYNTVFNNILRLRVHVLAMRMNMMMHALGVITDEENGNENNAQNGMSPQEIEELEFKIYNKDEKKEEDLECIICLENLKEGEEIRLLDCRHSFHRICIDKWLVLQRFCPYCRTLI